VTNLTGTASININGTVGATTATTGAFTTLSATGTLSGGTSGTAYSFSGSAPATSLTLNSSGNLLVGTTTSTARLNVINTGDANKQIVFSDNATFYGSVSHNSGNGLNEHRTESAGGHGFFKGTSATADMTLDSSGNLLVGTTSALSQTGRATFVGTGNALVTQVGNGTTAFQSTNTSGTSAYYAAIFSNNGNTFSTCGTIEVSGTTTSYNTSSDYRLKEDVQPMTGALAKIALLKPVTYKWKFDGSNSEGFIAHELAEVCPQAVSGEKDALKADGSIMPQGIDTSFLVATLTAAMQEQQALITQLTARITALETA